MSRQAGARELRCVDCDDSFTWSAEEQEFYRERGYEQPKRCKPCRAAKKAEREGGGQDRGGNR